MYKIPPQADSGVLLIDTTDVTCHAKAVDWQETSGTGQDDATWCNPAATTPASPTRTLVIDWKNSFSDGTVDGLYDILKGLADGAAHTVKFTPWPGDAAAPAFECKVIIPFAPLGKFAPDTPIAVATSWDITDFKYTKAVHS
jgi:hypothetical protein